MTWGQRCGAPVLVTDSAEYGHEGDCEERYRAPDCSDKILRVRWDGQTGATPGWCVEVLEPDAEGDLRVVIDSAKIGFPLGVDFYSEDQRGELVAALLEEYPGAKIEEEGVR